MIRGSCVSAKHLSCRGGVIKRNGGGGKVWEKKVEIWLENAWIYNNYNHFFKNLEGGGGSNNLKFVEENSEIVHFPTIKDGRAFDRFSSCFWP